MNITKRLVCLAALLCAFTAYAQETTPPEQTLDQPFGGKLDLYVDVPEETALSRRVSAEQKVNANPLGITFYRPTYVLPFYYTFKPAYEQYTQAVNNPTPQDQKLKNAEFLAQLSLQFPVWSSIMDSRFDLNIAYTQRAFWQFYADSQYFRETNYEPEIFLSRYFRGVFLGRLGFNHQSNGKGGDDLNHPERSWNRVFLEMQNSWGNWLIGVKAWHLVFQSSSSDLHNPDISRYLGHEQFNFVYRINRRELAFTARNIERPKYAAYELSWSFYLGDKLNIFLYGFSGYGQSMIEYQHKTEALGIGLALSNWI